MFTKHLQCAQCDPGRLKIVKNSEESRPGSKEYSLLPDADI